MWVGLDGLNSHDRGVGDVPPGGQGDHGAMLGRRSCGEEQEDAGGDEEAQEHGLAFSFLDEEPVGIVEVDVEEIDQG